MGGAAKPAAGVDQRLLAALILVLALAWTAISALSAGPHSAIHEDMAEAYVWGSHFEWGYYKHPPLWAWIAGAWFQVLPRTGWAFALLCGLNVAAGLCGCWVLIGLFASGDKRLAAFLLLLVTPFYAFNAFTFNANSVFISLWPWTAWAFVRAMDAPGPRTAVIFGLLAGADMMAKYYAVLLLAGCGAAALAHPKLKAYFASPWPYLALAVGLLVFAPHVVWLVQTGFLPFHYLDSESGHGVGYSIGTAVKLLLGDLALLGAVIVIVPIAARGRLAALPRRSAERLRDSDVRMVALLTLVPFLLTVAFGLFFRLKLSTNWTMGVFPLFPLLMIELCDPPDLRRLAAIGGGLGILIAAGGLIAAPFVVDFSREAKDKQPRRDAVDAAVQLWRTQTSAPIQVVGGDETYGDAAGFYAPGKPSVFIRFDPRISPWIDTRALPATGLLAICPAKDNACLAGAWRYRNSTTAWRRIVLPGHEPEASASTAGYPFIIAATPPGP